MYIHTHNTTTFYGFFIYIDFHDRHFHAFTLFLKLTSVHIAADEIS